MPVGVDLLMDAASHELRGAVYASHYGNPKRVAEALGIDYSNFTRNLNGEVPLKLATVFAVLELVDIPVTEFFSRVEQTAMRLGAQR
ncbi:hypothetical protein [Agromyces humi]|uniref:hypothetical protein n=1 Tax=Agromyces humi TaxID=1766800 RepID=UPI0013577298|nr:hypothetical protein [Agromyces humi]